MSVDVVECDCVVSSSVCDSAESVSEDGVAIVDGVASSVNVCEDVTVCVTSDVAC